jgi:hypothetical protein
MVAGIGLPGAPGKILTSNQTKLNQGTPGQIGAVN